VVWISKAAAEQSAAALFCRLSRSRAWSAAAVRFRDSFALRLCAPGAANLAQRRSFL